MIFQLISDYRAKHALSRLSPAERRAVLSGIASECSGLDRQIVRNFGYLDAELGTEFSAGISYTLRQLQEVRLRIFEPGSLEARTAASRFLCELGKLDSEFRKYPELYKPHLLQGCVADILEQSLLFVGRQRLDKDMRYPQNMEEFCAAYSALDCGN